MDIQSFYFSGWHSSEVERCTNTFTHIHISMYSVTVDELNWEESYSSPIKNLKMEKNAGEWKNKGIKETIQLYGVYLISHFPLRYKKFKSQTKSLPCFSVSERCLLHWMGYTLVLNTILHSKISELVVMGELLNKSEKKTCCTLPRCQSGNFSDRS